MIIPAEQEARNEAFEYRYGLAPGFLTHAAAETERLWQEHQSR